MAARLDVYLASARRSSLALQGSTNPVNAEGGPLPRVGVPLVARILESGIEIEVLRLAFDLKIGPCWWARVRSGAADAVAGR